MDKVEKLMANVEEIVTPEELKAVCQKDKPKGYIGFEPSGSVHIGWKICTNKIKDFIECGFDFTVLLAETLKKSSYAANIWKTVLLQWA